MSVIYPNRRYLKESKRQQTMPEEISSAKRKIHGMKNGLIISTKKYDTDMSLFFHLVRAFANAKGFIRLT